MSKTVKELADDLGVTRQYVQKIISQLPETKKPTKQLVSCRLNMKNHCLIGLMIKKNK